MGRAASLLEALGGSVSSLSHLLEAACLPWLVTTALCFHHQIAFSDLEPPAFLFSLSFFFCIGLRLQHREVPKLGVELEMPAYTTATATPDPSHDLHQSLWQCRIRRSLNPLSRARDRTCILMDASRVLYHGATMGSPASCLSCKDAWTTLGSPG